MKKIIVVALAMVMSVTMLTSCGKHEVTSIELEPEGIETIEEEETVTETIEVEDTDDTLERELCEKFGVHDYCDVDYAIVDNKLLEIHTHSWSESIYFDHELIK